MKEKGILVVVSGFSGAGKGTLMKKLMEDSREFALSISMTTRAPREGEVNGREYFFVTREEFEKKISENGLIEYAQYVGNYYGTPRDYVEEKLKAGLNVILEIEIQGAHKIKEQFPDALLLFVMPPSATELKRRLTSRGTETEEVIANRLKRATEEAVGIEDYDYILINDQLEECVAELKQIIWLARKTPDRNQEFIDHMKKELEAFAR